MMNLVEKDFEPPRDAVGRVAFPSPIFWSIAPDLPKRTKESAISHHVVPLPDYDSEVESEREGILPSEIHIPFNDSINEGIRNLEIEDAKSTLGRHSDHIQETARMTHDKIVKEANDTEKVPLPSRDREKQPVSRQ